MLKRVGSLLSITGLLLFFSCGGNVIKTQQNKIATDSANAIQGDSAKPTSPHESATNCNTDNEDTATYIPSVKIGTQVWMAENLCTDTFRNGDKIAGITEFGNTSKDIPKSPAYFCTCTGQKDDVFLYNWYAVNDKRGLAPKGWHVATVTDWMILQNYLKTNAAEKTKDTFGLHLQYSFKPYYYSPTMKQIFHLPIEDDFCKYEIGNSFGFWSATLAKPNGNNARFVQLVNSATSLLIFSEAPKWCGFPVRCVKDK